MKTRAAGRDRPQALFSAAKVGGHARLQTLYTLAAVTLAAIVPLIFLAGLWMRSELNKSQHETEAFLALQARGLSSRIDGQIRENLSALTAIAALPSLDSPSA